MSRINWREVLDWSEEQVEDLRYTGYSYIRQGKYEIALPFFQALTILDPESAYDAQTLAAIYIQINQPSEAMVYLDRALKIDADHTPTLLNLMKAFFMLGKREEGLRLANILKSEADPSISNVAKALILAHS